MLKTNLKKLDVYFPILFKLEDDGAIIHSDLLKHIENKLIKIKYLDEFIFSKLDQDQEFHYLINQKCFQSIQEDDPKIKSLVAHAFYYHHRLIFHAHIEYNSLDFAFRTIRMQMIALFQEIANATINKINLTISNAKKDFIENPKKEAITSNLSKIKIKTFYSYCIVFQPKKSDFLKKNNQIQTFNIRTLQPKSIPINRTSLLRISIPNMTAYYNGKLSTEYKSEIINTIYKICLYEKKISELSITDNYEKYDFNVALKHQAINEKMIMDMWTYCLDAFGGKRTDQIGNKGAAIGLIFSLVAFVFSIISLIQSFMK